MVFSDSYVHRLLTPEPNVAPHLLDGLHLSPFTEFSAAGRAASGPFIGPAAENLNGSEAFFQDALAAIRARALRIPDPFGGADLSTSDVLVSPSGQWPSVPIFAFRFAARETFYFLKRGHAWCQDLGLYFPRRALLVSLQREERRIVQDQSDLRHAFEFFARHRHESSPASSSAVAPWDRPCVFVNSDHFGHHVWNELSVVEGVVSEGLQGDVLFLVNKQPLGSIARLFPEIPEDSIVRTEGGVEEPYRLAMQRSAFVVPAGRRFIPTRVIERLLRCAADEFALERARAADFRNRHELVIWIGMRVDARTATNLSEALAAVISRLLRRYPTLGVVFDGFTLNSTGRREGADSINDREREAIADIVASVGDVFDYVSLPGRFTMEAFLWAEASDYYVCPYGTAQHKIAWINPVPGTVHVGENKRPVAARDAAYHARQRGFAPSFFFGAVTHVDAVRDDGRRDLFSYELNVEELATHVTADVLARAAPGRATNL